MTKKEMKLSSEHFNFGEALEHLKNGLAVTRHGWKDNVFVVKQINSDIDESVIPHMTFFLWRLLNVVKKFVFIKKSCNFAA